MEAATFYRAFGAASHIHALVVKGVSDYGDGSKNDAYHEYAARASAVYLLSFIQEYVTEQSMPRRDALPSSSRAGPLGVWNVPYHRNPLFIGREEILQQLQRHLTPGTVAALIQPLAISGLGGIGKTQTAVEFAYRVRPDYQAVFWLQADSQEILALECAKLAEPLRLSAPNEQNHLDYVEEVKRWLRGHTKWLLILENVEDLQMMQEFLPAGHLGCVLLTTRAQVVGPLMQKYELQKMSEQEGVLFLMPRTEILRREQRLDQVSEDHYQLAKQIWQLVDGLPLALDQAGAYILETGCGFSTYCKLYQQQRAVLLRERGKLFIGHPESVTTTFLLCFEKIKQMNPAAVDILRMCAILHAESVSEELFTEGIAYYDPGLASVTSNLDAWNKALSILRAYSLVSRDSDKNTLTVHRLVQEVIKDGLSEQEQSILATCIVQALNHVFPYHEAVNWWMLGRQYISQVLAGVELIVHLSAYVLLLWRPDEEKPLYPMKLRMESPESAQLLAKAGEYLFFTSPRASPNYRLRANNLLVIAHYIQEKVLEPDHPDFAHTRLILARYYNGTYAWGTSEDIIKQALTIYEKALGPDHPETASALNLLARFQMDNDENTEAEKNFEQALAIREKALGPDHPLTANTLNDMGRFYEDHRGDYKRAETLYRRALQIDEKTRGVDDPVTAIVLNNLGLVLKKQGKYEEAEPFYQQALHIREQWYDADHLMVEQALNNLAKLYIAQQKYEQARPLLLCAYQNYKKNYGITQHTINLLLDLLELDLPQNVFKEIVDSVGYMYQQWSLHRLPNLALQEMLDDLEHLISRK